MVSLCGGRQLSGEHQCITTQEHRKPSLSTLVKDKVQVQLV